MRLTLLLLCACRPPGWVPPPDFSVTPITPVGQLHEGSYTYSVYTFDAPGARCFFITGGGGLSCIPLPPVNEEPQPCTHCTD